MPFRSAQTQSLLAFATPLLLGSPFLSASAQAAQADSCKELPQMCRTLPPSFAGSAKLLKNGGPMNNLPGYANLGTKLNAVQNYLLTLDTTAKAIKTLAAIGDFEHAHPDVVTNAPRQEPGRSSSPQESATYFWTRIPEEAAILRENDISPIDLQFTFYALGRAKGVAENARTPHQIALLCNNSIIGGGCTLQQVMFVREHYTELKAQWNSFESLRNDTSMIWTKPL